MKAFVSLTWILGMLMTLALSAGAQDSETSIYEHLGPMPEPTEIDRFVTPHLTELGIEPALCSDAVFVRRIYLDVIGTLPTAEEARTFIEDDTESKRALLIDQLLERDEYADYWAMKWGDALRIKAEFPINLWPNAAQAYHRWVRTSIQDGKPYDEFVREMLTSSGSNFRVGPVNFYRALQNKTPEGLAEATALTFMGSRVDSWPEDRAESMAAFFSQVGYKPTSEWKEEVVFWDPFRSSENADNVAPGQAEITTINPPEEGEEDTEEEPEEVALPVEVVYPITVVFPDGAEVQLTQDLDPREVFADWLITSENPWFTKIAANRVWAWLIGTGVIHEPDDIRDDNPPSNPELLAYLEQELITSGYDLKHLYRLILNSNTYQFSSLPQADITEAEANFGSYKPRRLEAEVLIDALNAITGTTDLYTSPIPEPFTYIPKDQPAIALADGSITSPFLALFGRSARSTGMMNERNNNPVSAQWLHMLNSSHIQTKLTTGPHLRTVFAPGRDWAEAVDELYLTVLSRYPTEEEQQIATQYLRTTKNRNIAALDTAWVLINSPEFLYRH
jgi:hypothetical protein